MLTFDLTLKKNYKVKAISLDEAAQKLKRFTEKTEESPIRNSDLPTIISDTHEDIKLTEFWD